MFSWLIQRVNDSIKVARYNNSVAISSIFESLLLKKIDLYGKTIMTHVLLLPID